MESQLSDEAHFGQGEVVILVDDLPAITRATAKILGAIGYQVESFIDPKDALARAVVLAGQEDYRLDLLITDVIMPGMVGTELAKHIRSIFPDVKILFITGYDHQLIDAYAQETGEEVHFVMKPCPAKLLAQKIRETLGKQ